MKSLFASSKVGNCGQLEHHHVYRWHPCSASWSLSRVWAACSRPSNAARSNVVRFLSRERFRPRLRASESSSSSLSRSRQLRTPFESPRIEHLLKTSRSNLPYGEQKANIIFRLMFAPGHVPSIQYRVPIPLPTHNRRGPRRQGSLQHLKHLPSFMKAKQRPPFRQQQTKKNHRGRHNQPYPKFPNHTSPAIEKLHHRSEEDGRSN